MKTIPVKYSETVLHSDLLKNATIDKDVYLNSLVYDGMRSMQVRKNGADPIPAFALHFSGTTTEGNVIGLSFLFSIRNIDEISANFGLEPLYQFYEIAIIDNIIILSDTCRTDEYISSSNMFTTKKGSEHPVYFFADTKGSIHKIFLTRKQILLIDYIKTFFNNGMVPAREYNSAILEIPDTIKNIDVEITTDTKVDLLGIYYEGIDKKTALYRALFTISGINGLFIVDFNGKTTAKTKLKGKKVYTNFEKMFENIVMNNYEDNTYILDIGHACTSSYKKTIKSNTVIDKKIFIYANKDNGITETFTFYKGQFELVMENVINQISENISEGIFQL